tara:strand:+ start:121716 stop:122894 length:1179 start_codon:yes stop_codon:yes gene_type:complete
MTLLKKRQMRGFALTTASLVIMASGALADQVILDDLIVDGSICVGFDCVNGESFGFDTLRLKENNLRIKAQDTSTSASFPTVDWQITFNDTSNGGQNKFSIDDIDSGRTPFTIEASARTNSLYVDDAGRIGVGTATPVVRVHMKDGNTPTMRLEQDGSSGFTAQTWDVAGNEAGFFVRDATNGSTLPFRILPGAASQALVIDGSSEVGIGAGTNPSAALHIKRSDNSVQLLIEETGAGFTQMLKLLNNGAPRAVFDNSATAGVGEWHIGLSSPGDEFLIRNHSSGTNAVTVSQAGNMTLTGSLITTGGGGACTAVDPCDAVFDPEKYTVPSIDDHARDMWANKYLPAVGPTNAETPIDMTVKMLRMLNELEKAHIYIEQLHTRLSVLEQQDG